MHVEEMWTGRELDYYTTAPGVQLYTGNWLGDEHAKDDANYGWGAGFALEAEMYPDTPHHALFPQGIVGPGHPYSNVIEYHFMSTRPTTRHIAQQRPPAPPPTGAASCLNPSFRCHRIGDITKLCRITTMNPLCPTTRWFIKISQLVYLRFILCKFDMLGDKQFIVVNRHSFGGQRHTDPYEGKMIRFPPSPRDQLNRLPMGSGAELGDSGFLVLCRAFAAL